MHSNVVLVAGMDTVQSALIRCEDTVQSALIRCEGSLSWALRIGESAASFSVSSHQSDGRQFDSVRSESSVWFKSTEMVYPFSGTRITDM